MKLYKRSKDGPYWYRFRFQGHRIEKSTGVHRKADALDIAAAYRTQLAKGEVGFEPAEAAPLVPTFREAMTEFLEWSITAKKPNTHKRYVTSSKALLAYFGDNVIDTITKDDVEKFMVQRSRQKKLPQGKKSKKTRKATKLLRPATINRELACLKHLFEQNEDLIPKNPVKKVKFLDEDNEQTRVLNAEEEKLYLLAASQPLQDIATIMVETGMRPEEVCRIARENVFLEQGYLFNPYGKTKAARRKLPLSKIACTILEKRLDQAKGNYLFPGRLSAGMKPEDAGPIVKVNAAHTAAVKRCEVKPFRLYDLRHTWATRMAQAGVDLVTLAALLGHSKINMVLRYAHPTEEHQFAAMKKLEDYKLRQRAMKSAK
jgi:integrase